MDLITAGHKKGFEPSLEPEDLARKVERWQYLVKAWRFIQPKESDSGLINLTKNNSTLEMPAFQ